MLSGAIAAGIVGSMGAKPTVTAKANVFSVAIAVFKSGFDNSVKLL